MRLRVSPFYKDIDLLVGAPPSRSHSNLIASRTSHLHLPSHGGAEAPQMSLRASQTSGPLRWLIPRSLLSPGSVHVVACVPISFRFKAEIIDEPCLFLNFP